MNANYRNRLAVLIGALSIGACDNPGKPVQLPNNDVVRVAAASMVGDTYSIDYSTGLKFDRAALGRQAELLFPLYRVEAERLGAREVVLWPSVRELGLFWVGWRPVVGTNRATDFGYRRSPDGDWVKSWR